MTLQEYVAYWTGKPLIFSGVYGIQCMSVPHQYLYDVLNLTDKTYLAQPLAREVFENFDNVGGHQFFTKVVNTPDNVPNPGDIVVWGSPAGQYKDANGTIQYAGHIAVFISGDVNSFTSFDENWPEGSLPHLQTHTYDGVLGWLSPIPQQPQVTVAQVQQQLKDETEITSTCQQQLKAATDLNKTQQEQNTQLQTDLKELQLNNATLKSENDKLIEENDLFTTDRKNYNDEANLAKSQAAKLTEYLDTIAAHAGVEFRGQTDDKITAAVMLVLSQNATKISDLQNQLKRYNDVKNAVSQTIGAIPSSTKQNIFKSFLNIFLTQN